jgi:hypothetical protein
MDPWAHDADTPGAVMENASGGEVREAILPRPSPVFLYWGVMRDARVMRDA